MGLFGWLFNSANIIVATSRGDMTLYRRLHDEAVAVLNDEGYTRSQLTWLSTIENDKGFFSDIFSVFTNPMYDELKNADTYTFFLSVTSTSMLGGMYAYFCAKIVQKPLYANYNEVMRRFRNEGPLPCVMKFLRYSYDHNSPEQLSRIINAVVDSMTDEERRSALSGQGLMALARAMYDTGITMGMYFI